MKPAALLLLILAGCSSAKPQPMRIEFSCVSYVKGEYIISDCGDEQSWKDYLEKRTRAKGF